MESYDPNVYIRGGNTEIRVEVTAQNGEKIMPVLCRLTIESPDGTVVTFSGGDLTAASGYLFYLNPNPQVGWVQYESWARDANGREDVATRGYEVIDRIL